MGHLWYQTQNENKSGNTLGHLFGYMPWNKDMCYYCKRALYGHLWMHVGTWALQSLSFVAPSHVPKVWKFEALFKVLFILYKQIYTCLLFIFSHPKCFNSSAPPKVSQPKVSQPKVSQPKVSQPTVSPFFPEPGHGVSTKSQSELCSIKNIGLTSKPHRADTCIPKKQNIVLWTQNVFHRKEEYKTS